MSATSAALLTVLLLTRAGLLARRFSPEEITRMLAPLMN